MKNLSLFTLICAAVFAVTSCKQQAILVNQGAVVSKDGTDDGLNNVKGEFNDASRTDDGIKFTLSSDLLFPTNSSYLTDKAKVELSKLTKIMKEKSAKNIRVDGHTDATGTVEYNVWLSDKRATSVKKFLQDSGIPSSRITTQGLGQAKPVSDNKTPEGRQKNRRVEVTILN